MGRLPHNALKDPAHSSFNQLFNDYKLSAKKRGLVFRLTKEEFALLTKQPCYYCGTPPSQIRKRPGGREGYVYSGVDRVKNKKGYVPSNVVSCCGRCNDLKSASDFDAFINHAARIGAYNIFRFGLKIPKRRA